MKIKYQIDTQKKIIIETWPGEVKIENYIEVKQSQFKDSDFNPDFDVITDLRGLTQKYAEETIQKIADFMAEHSDNMRDRKSAIIADNPHSVASAYVFKEKCKTLPVRISIFTTIDAALEWLNY